MKRDCECMSLSECVCVCCAYVHLHSEAQFHSLLILSSFLISLQSDETLIKTWSRSSSQTCIWQSPELSTLQSITGVDQIHTGKAKNWD